MRHGHGPVATTALGGAAAATVARLRDEVPASAAVASMSLNVCSAAAAMPVASPRILSADCPSLTSTPDTVTPKSWVSRSIDS